MSEVAKKKHRNLDDHIKMRCFFRENFWSFTDQYSDILIRLMLWKNIAKFKHEFP